MARTAITNEEHEVILQEIIEGLNKLKKIKGWAVVSQEGLVIEQQMPKDINPHLLAGNAAALAHSAQVVSSQTGAGSLNTLILDSEKYKVVLVGGNFKIILLVIAEHSSDLQSLAGFLEASANRFQAD
ncbi:MAG: roadblock/LC7 domain-containing protein [Promethearchaeota archaeon]